MTIQISSELSSMKASPGSGWRRFCLIAAAMCGLFLARPGIGGGLLPPVQTGSLLDMTNGNVSLQYDLNTGRANFYWQNSLKISGFYAGVGLYSGDTLTNYVTGTAYSSRTWTVTNNTVEITLTGNGLPTMEQTFVLAQTNSLLTRVDM